jgi:6-phosphogluconolactonase
MGRRGTHRTELERRGFPAAAVERERAGVTTGVSWQPEVVFGGVDELARIFVSRVEQRFADLGRVSLALPGGSAAAAFCPALAEARVRWRDVDVFWVDERAVPPDHADSNYRIADDLLLSRVDADPARIHRMGADAPDLDAAARDYERRIIRASGAPPHFDVVLLGVGGDGHVCSLFPDHAALDERARLVVPIVDSPKPPPRRLTITLPALAGALVVVAAFDASKSRVIRGALNDPASPLPVARAARAAGRAVFLLDPSLAG